MKNSFNPYDLCPCDSGKKAKFCCWTGKGWDKKPPLLKPSQPISNYSHEKCYASKTANCSTKISGEHFISNNILAGLEWNKKVKIVGLPWQERETFNLLSRSSLVANILCTTHNEALSPFDSEAGRLNKTILKFDEDFNLDNPTEDFAIFCGEDLEKWMLKTACAFIASNQITENGQKINCQIKDIYLAILFEDEPFPDHWGMYYKIPEDKTVQKYHSISFRSMTANGDLLAAEFLVNNFMFYLLLGKPDYPSSFGIYRPRGIQFAKGNIKKRIEICWQDKKYNEGIFMERVRTTPEAPKEWDEYLKK